MDLKNYDEKSCGIIVFHEDEEERKYLLLHYPSGHWDFPKGHIEEGETEKETAARELLEETGIADIEFVEGFRETIDYIYRQKGELSNKLVVYFLAKTNLQKVKMSHEHKDFTWLPYEAAFNRVTFDNAKNLLKKAKEFLKD